MNVKEIDPDPPSPPRFPILDNKYKILYQIGDGQYAKVKLSEDLGDGEMVAIKMFKNKQMDRCEKLDRFMEEVRILAQCSHKNIIKILGACISGTLIRGDGSKKSLSYIVLKYAKFGEIYRLINLTGKFSERMARTLFTHIIDGLEYLQSQSLSHLDLKTENLLIDSQCVLRIADFGCATLNRDTTTLEPIIFNTSLTIGSLEYNAPEINMDGNFFGEEADIFSVGVCLFLMVVGFSPFRMAHTQDTYYRSLMKQDKSRFWKTFHKVPISDHFKDLFNRMTERKVNRRINVKDIRSHMWMQGPVLGEKELEQELQDRYRVVEENLEMTEKSSKSIKSSNSDDQIIEKNPTEGKYQKQRAEYRQECACITERIRNGGHHPKDSLPPIYPEGKTCKMGEEWLGMGMGNIGEGHKDHVPHIRSFGLGGERGIGIKKMEEEKKREDKSRSHKARSPHTTATISPSNTPLIPPPNKSHPPTNTQTKKP